ncbi:hypothetical protein M8818_006664 [Zalaria obscura]|uniref:Uncharacterized protein n=1 Tax=Zalaria obscura TaxID=2024903 RepID=A0ACC3S5C9_9PEZI
MTSRYVGAEVPVRSFEVLNGSEKNLTIRITEPNVSADNLALETWASSEVLSNILHKSPVNFPAYTLVTTSERTTLPVVELGAGTGLVGMSAAAIWHVPVVLTDLEGIVPGLAANIALNREVLAAAGGTARCGSLDWREPILHIASPNADETTAAKERKAHVLLAADTVYDERHPKLMSEVVLEWLSKDEGARFFVTWAQRVAYLDYIRELWELLEEGGLEAMEFGTERASDDIFNDETLCEWSVWRWKKDAL